MMDEQTIRFVTLLDTSALEQFLYAIADAADNLALRLETDRKAREAADSLRRKNEPNEQ